MCYWPVFYKMRGFISTTFVVPSSPGPQTFQLGAKSQPSPVCVWGLTRLSEGQRLGDLAAKETPPLFGMTLGPFFVRVLEVDLT